MKPPWEVVGKRYFIVDWKSFEVEKVEGLFTVVERGKGKPHQISFSISVIDQILKFVGKACNEGACELRETAHFNGGSLFLSRKVDEWGRFIRLCEWKPKVRNPFMILPEGE